MSTQSRHLGTLAPLRERVATQSPGEGSRRRNSARSLTLFGAGLPTLFGAGLPTPPTRGPQVSDSPGDLRSSGWHGRETGHNKRTAHSARAGFTLTELLVVIGVIALLAGLSLGALQAARESAKEARTRATIAKLDKIVMDMYESYRTRRVPINIPAGTHPKAAAVTRLYAIRDLMRMEMPEQWTDVNDPPVTVIPRPGLSQAYVARKAAATGAAAVPYAESAKCLYMLVTMGNPEARGQFAENEVVIDSGDNLPYFVDGWGRPIYFFRWPAGFTPINGADTDVQTGDPMTDHDPFDPRRVDADAFRLVPLIYSAGPDGTSDLDAVSDYSWTDDTYTTGARSGKPLSGGKYYDNIHNQRSGAK